MEEQLTFCFNILDRFTDWQEQRWLSHTFLVRRARGLTGSKSIRDKGWENVVICIKVRSSYEGVTTFNVESLFDGSRASEGTIYSSGNLEQAKREADRILMGAELVNFVRSR